MLLMTELLVDRGEKIIIRVKMRELRVKCDIQQMQKCINNATMHVSEPNVYFFEKLHKWSEPNIKKTNTNIEKSNYDKRMGNRRADYPHLKMER